MYRNALDLLFYQCSPLPHPPPPRRLPIRPTQLPRTARYLVANYHDILYTNYYTHATKASGVVCNICLRGVGRPNPFSLGYNNYCYRNLDTRAVRLVLVFVLSFFFLFIYYYYRYAYYTHARIMSYLLFSVCSSNSGSNETLFPGARSCKMKIIKTIRAYRSDRSTG